MSDIETECQELRDSYNQSLEKIAELESELNYLKAKLDGHETCKLISIPLHAEGELKVEFEGNCKNIKAHIRKVETTASTPLNCQYIVVTGNLISMEQWAPLDSFIYEPLPKSNTN